LGNPYLKEAEEKTSLKVALPIFCFHKSVIRAKQRLDPSDTFTGCNFLDRARSAEVMKRLK